MYPQVGIIPLSKVIQLDSNHKRILLFLQQIKTALQNHQPSFKCSVRGMFILGINGALSGLTASFVTPTLTIFQGIMSRSS